MDVSNLAWAVTIGVIAALILVDLFTVSSKPHDVMFKEATLWSIFYIGLCRHWDEDPDPGENFLVKRVRKRMATVDEYYGTKLFVRLNGKRFATPMFLVMISISYSRGS